MPLRLQADNDVRAQIIRDIRQKEPAFDIRTAHEAGIAGLSDLDVLAFAAHEGRILVSHDFATMPIYFREFTRRQRSPGVLLAPQSLPIGIVVESLRLIWGTATEIDFEDRVLLIPTLTTMVYGVRD